MLEDLTDDSLMPFGKYAGSPMLEVPNNHLLYIWKARKTEFKDSAGFGLRPDEIQVMRYIEDCFNTKDLL